MTNLVQDRALDTPRVRARRRPNHDARSAVLMTLPALLPFLVFGLIPLLWVVYIAFTHYDGVRAPTWAGLENFRAVLRDATWWASVKNTFVFGAWKLAIEIPLALILAVILNNKVFGASWFRAIFFLPYVTSISVMGVIFLFIFQPYQGILNGLLQGLHLIHLPIDYLGRPTSAMIVLIAVGVWSGFGVNMILLTAGLQSIPRDVYESADLDGASKAQQLWYITVPLLGPVLRTVLMLSIVFTLRSFDLIKVLTNGGPFGSTEVMFTYIFRYFFGYEFAAQYGYASALGLVASVLVVFVSIVFFRATRRLDQ